MSSKGIGLDIGTNMLVSAMMNDDGNPVYKKQRDAFFRITPKSDINAKSIRRALEDKKANFIMEEYDFIVVGEDALIMANERNGSARRPMRKGVLSPKEKDSLPMIKLLIKSLLTEGVKDSSLVFSIPAEPVDGAFDIFFHTEMMKTYIKEMGFDPTPINEGFAIAFSELLDDGVSGLCLSFGAGMINTAVCYEGDPVLQFSLTRGGDWIDTAAGHATDEEPSLIQIEKEGGADLLNPISKMHEAIAVYYRVLIKYALDNIIYELEKKRLPSFHEALPIVLSGGLTLANGFMNMFEDELKGRKFPFEVKELRKASDPMTCVAHGCLMASVL